MRKWLNNYFDITKGEFNGLLILVMLIAAVSLAPKVYSLLRPFDPDPFAEQHAVLELQKVLASQEKSYKSPGHRLAFKPGYRSDTENVKKPEVVLFPFDPNINSKEEWQQLGFSEKQAQSILNYVHKGGRFRKPEDLQKMYVVSQTAYEKLKPYVRIKTPLTAVSAPNFSKQQTVVKVPKAAVMVEINRADTLELDKISGIGPAFARRIVKYRDRIGGFYKKEQLLEVFGLDSVKFNEIKNQVMVDATAVKKLNMNRANFDDLKNHPYLRYKQVNAILQYREQHGNYGNFADLKKVAILTPDILERLEPYISFSP
jgi:competence protein ComEA